MYEHRVILKFNNLYIRMVFIIRKKVQPKWKIKKENQQQQIN